MIVVCQFLGIKMDYVHIFIVYYRHIVYFLYFNWTIYVYFFQYQNYEVHFFILA